MTSLRSALIEKVGREHGFEHVVEAGTAGVTMASARHRTRVTVNQTGDVYTIILHPASPSLLPELQRNFATLATAADAFATTVLDELARLLRRAASLAQALPSQAADDYQVSVTKALASLPASIQGTEVERMVRQRVGQQCFRQAQFDYWGGACAVTGIALPEVLRASHAKPWAECASDAERLDVFNGFLLSANLDALFDRFLISFDDAGLMLLSLTIPVEERARIGLYQPSRLRWVTDRHLGYLHYHRTRFDNGRYP
jgi:putative restriction endonuclease